MNHRTTIPKVIIGLVGPSGSGKSTVCKYFKDRHKFSVFHSGALLKSAFAAMFNVSRDYCESPLIDQPADFLGGLRPRAVIEGFGNLAATLFPTAWTMQLDKKIRTRKSQYILVDGVRQHFLAAVIHKHSGHIIRIDGAEIDPAKPGDLWQAQVAGDFVVQYSPLDELYRQLDAIAEKIIPKQ